MTTGAVETTEVRHAPAFDADESVRSAAHVLKVAGAGVLLADDGVPGTMALASDESVYRLCALEADGVPGPAADSLSSGGIVRCADPEADRARWPAYVEALHAAGYAGVIAVPVVGDGRPSGVLVLCQRRAVRLSAERMRLAEVLASLLIETAVRGQAMRRLQAAIDSLGATMRRIDREVLNHGDGRG